MKSQPSIHYIIIFCLFVVFHLAAFFSGWYLVYDWLDKVTHFLGGLALAAVLVYLSQARKWPLSFSGILGVVLLLAVLWEAHEFILDKFIAVDSMKTQKSLEDTFLDLFFGTLGATIFLACQRFLLSRAVKN